MKKQKITIETNGTHRGTKLYIDNQRIYFESLQLVGDKTIDYDLIIGLTQSKATKEQVKSAGNCADAVGFTVVDYEDDLEEDTDV